jgi:uncharacterized repeat protein (TIGR04076 family)
MSAVMARVISRKGTCEAQYKVGDEFVVGGKTPPPTIVQGLITPFSLLLRSCFMEVLSPGSKTQTKLPLPVPTQKMRWCLNSGALRPKR